MHVTMTTGSITILHLIVRGDRVPIDLHFVHVPMKPSDNHTCIANIPTDSQPIAMAMGYSYWRVLRVLRHFRKT